MPRLLQPELLDALPPEHPDAVHSRRDLRLINGIMGNHRWFSRTLAGLRREGDRVLEIGAGTGELAGRLTAPGRPVDALDLAPRPPGWPVGRVWHQADLLSFGGYGGYDAVIGNLVFHHFSPAELAALGRSLRDTARFIVACEPARRASSRRIFALVAPLFRANHVTLHDAAVSIAAGFRGDELPQLLGLRQPAWAWQCQDSLLGAYRMVAWRT